MRNILVEYFTSGQYALTNGKGEYVKRSGIRSGATFTTDKGESSFGSKGKMEEIKRILETEQGLNDLKIIQLPESNITLKRDK